MNINFILKKTIITIYHLRTFIYIFVCIISKKLNNETSTTSNLWLIGENYGNCIHDNGYHFFTYCQTQENKENIFFVVNKKILQRLQVPNTSKNNVLVYGSYKHIKTLLYSSTLLFSHSPRDLIYPLVQPWVFKKQCIVFLQHGVSGLKKANKDQLSFIKYISIFIATSKWEKNIIENSFNINKNKIKITGFSRYDTLIDKSPSNKIILYIPTWRDWINQQQISPQYTIKIIAFLNSVELKQHLKKYQFELKIFFHKNMLIHCSKIKNKLTNKHISIVTPIEKSVHQLLQESNIMITDYSSVSWDFIYLKKPVIFFQFDRDEFLKNRGSHMDLSKIPIGYSTDSQDKAILKLEKLLVNNTNNYTPNIFSFNDKNNSLRIYTLVDSQRGYNAFLN